MFIFAVFCAIASIGLIIWRGVEFKKAKEGKESATDSEKKSAEKNYKISLGFLIGSCIFFILSVGLAWFRLRKKQ